jgi:hypothetical protein
MSRFILLLAKASSWAVDRFSLYDAEGALYWLDTSFSVWMQIWCWSYRERKGSEQVKICWLNIEVKHSDRVYIEYVVYLCLCGCCLEPLISVCPCFWINELYLSIYRRKKDFECIMNLMHIYSTSWRDWCSMERPGFLWLHSGPQLERVWAPLIMQVLELLLVAW